MDGEASGTRSGSDGSNERPEPHLEIVFGAAANPFDREPASLAVDYEFVAKACVAKRFLAGLREDCFAIDFNSHARGVNRMLHLDEVWFRSTD
jgi:hypothetical protein